MKRATGKMDFSTKEQERLKAVQYYLQFNLNREKELKDIAELASVICETPIALITLLDKEIQWIKAKVGTDVEQMPRATSFCTHAIETEEVMVVPDAIQDKRFALAPVVAGNPGVRFYASANLKSFDGYNVGTLCVFDLKPKQLSATQEKALTALANQVSHIMELDRAIKLLERQNDALTEIARIQSHEVRSPVSSILGLMQLIREQDYVPEKEHLVLLEESAIQLDQKIRMIVNETTLNAAG